MAELIVFLVQDFHRAQLLVIVSVQINFHVWFAKCYSSSWSVCISLMVSLFNVF
jgi:hypothetical protein